MSYCGLANGDMTGQLDSKLDISLTYLSLPSWELNNNIVQNNNYYVV